MNEVHAAELLAELHGHGAELFGPFRQPNVRSGDWPTFFAEHRLLYMADIATERGELPAEDRERLETIADGVPTLLDHTPRPAVIHGDVWSGNVLSREGRVTGFLDAAIYYADPEVELAFIELFGTFGSAFFDRYRKIRGIEPGYFEVRRDVYQLYPLLVHVAVFGKGYLPDLRVRMRRIEVQLRSR